MTISVLMSVYKKEKADYLNLALKSVWDDQELKPNEIVLIQDGPLGEDLLAVIKDWKKKLGGALKVHVNQENIGLTKSLNIGIGLISSDLIARMDSDDISLPCRFRVQHDFLLSHPGVDIMGGAVQEFDESNDCRTIRHYPQTNEKIREAICKGNPLAHPTVMIRRTLFYGSLRYDEQFCTCQDLALWFDALSKGFQIANLDDIVLKFRMVPDVWHRRSSLKNINNECKIYFTGIYHIWGLWTLKYVYPISRLCFRLMPSLSQKIIYRSKLRDKFLNK